MILVGLAISWRRPSMTGNGAKPSSDGRQWRRVGLQMVGPHRGGAELLQAAVLFEQVMGLSSLVPIDPRPGTVPPTG